MTGKDDSISTFVLFLLCAAVLLLMAHVISIKWENWRPYAPYANVSTPTSIEIF